MFTVAKITGRSLEPWDSEQGRFILDEKFVQTAGGSKHLIKMLYLPFNSQKRINWRNSNLDALLGLTLITDPHFRLNDRGYDWDEVAVPHVLYEKGHVS